MNNMRIVYDNIELREYDKNNHYKPLRFRMSLERINDVFLIKKEYFKSGFHDGEKDDFVFCFYSGYFVKYLTKVSIMTQKIDDPIYLKSFEKILMQEYMNHCESLIPELTKYLEKTTIDINKDIINARKSLKFLSNYDRIKKLKNINNNEKT